MNVKSLYRLTEDEPLQKIDLRIAAAICHTVGIALSDLITFERPKAQLKRLDGRALMRLDALMAKNNEGRLTTAQRKEFVALADQAHRISMENARTLPSEWRRAGKLVTTGRMATLAKRVGGNCLA